MERLLAAACVSSQLKGEKCRIGIISTRWNKEIIDSLKGGIKEALKECDVPDEFVFETEV